MAVAGRALRPAACGDPGSQRGRRPSRRAGRPRPGDRRCRAGPSDRPTEAAAHLAAAIEARLAEPAPAPDTLPDLAVELRTELARRAGDTEAAVAGLAALERRLGDEGLGDLAARYATRRAALLLHAERPEDALEAALPAPLALDLSRLDLPDAARRFRRLHLEVADGYATALRAAAACGAVTVVTELLEFTRTRSVPHPRSPDERDDAVSVLTGPPDAAAAHHRTAVSAPPGLGTPWGTRALGAYLEQVRRYRADRATDGPVSWRVAEDGP